MKKILIITVIMFWGISLLFSQNQNDVLRFSQSLYGGTARATSMGGAYGALGGDISSLSYNPGGIGVYRTNEFTISPGIMFNQSDANYIPSTGVDDDNIYNFNLNNIGLVATYRSGENSEWANINFAVAYNKLNNLNLNLSASGINPKSSMIDLWFDDANQQGVQPKDLANDDTWMAREIYLIDTVPDTRYEYGHVLYDPYEDKFMYGLQQTKNSKREGSMGEYIFAFGANYGHKLYVGASFGINVLRYEETINYMERDVNNQVYDFNEFIYSEHYKINGSGFNAKIGFIYKPLDWLRVGGAVHTPIFWSMDQEFHKSMTSYFETPDQSGKSSYDAYISLSENSFEITTPFKAMLSLGGVIKKMGLISFDYEFVDYSKMRLRYNDEQQSSSQMQIHENATNDAIREEYAAAHNLRVGAEYRIGVFSLRAGYNYYGSPYKSGDPRGENKRNSFSGGLGLISGSFFMDLAFIHTKSKYNYLFYDEVPELPLAGAKIDSKTNRILMTFGYKF